MEAWRVESLSTTQICRPPWLAEPAEYCAAAAESDDRSALDRDSGRAAGEVAKTRRGYRA
jgi:hypothetical protein